MKDFRVGAFALIFDDRDRVFLCLREDLDIWNLPSGGTEQGEPPWTTVVREVREETGLDVRVERLSGVYWRPEQTEVNFAFVCRVVGGALVRTWEAVETGYFPPDEIPERTVARHVDRVRDALEHPDETVMKTQFGVSWWESVEQGGG